MNRQIRILLFVLAGILWSCGMVCNATCIEAAHIETTHVETINVETMHLAPLAEDVCAWGEEAYTLTEEVCDCNGNSVQTQRESFTFTSPDQALPIARVKRIAQTTSPTKVMKDRIFSNIAQPKAVAQVYKQNVTSYLQYSYNIFLALPPEEIAFPFATFW